VWSGIRVLEVVGLILEKFFNLLIFVRLCRCKSNVWLAAGGDAIFSLSEKTAEEMSVLDLESHHKARWSKQCYGDC